MNDIIDLEPGPDGVFRPSQVRRIRKSREPKSEKQALEIAEMHQIIKEYVFQSYQERQAEELLHGFDIGMNLFSRLTKALREGK